MESERGNFSKKYRRESEVGVEVEMRCKVELGSYIDSTVLCNAKFQ
jgi:hypothetical protein